MSDERSRELLIPFETFDTRGIRKDIPENITSSFFFDIYAQAFKLVDLIDKSNTNYEGYLNKNAGKLRPELELDDFQNVIAFIGRRGTGKTSSMLSFLEMLVTNYFQPKNDDYFKSAKFSFINRGFYAIPYTDASMLSKHDDIFETVLSKMLSSLNFETGKSYIRRDSTVSESEIKKLREEICKVYDHYSSLKKKEDTESASPYGLMEKISNKHSVREEFIRLVSKYTGIIGQIRENKKADYLVICIDDIDMVHDKHMEIMQCIHQYFMIPKVIVLVSFNKPILNASLQADFFSNVSISQSDSEEHDLQMRLTRNQTYDFVRKIIPADMCITMPSWKKKDYVEMSPIKVDFGEYGDDNNYQNLSNIMFPRLKESSLLKMLIEKKVNSNEKMLLTPKEMIMIMLADRTSVYLDIKGYKFHFMQPDSLRALSDMFYLLYNMENLNKFKRKDSENRNDEDKFQQSRDKNRKILLDYLHFKMLPENNFPAEIEELVNSVLDSPMERRGRIIWDYYFTLLSTDKNRERIVNLYGEDFYNEEINRHKIEKYSFGALYRVLYSATRLSVIDRKVVIFLLASFAFSMPNFIELEKARNNPSIVYEKPDNYIRIREAFGHSLIGTWCKDLFGGKNVNIVISKSAYKNKSSVNKLLYILSLISTDTSTPLNVEENEKEYVVKAEIDPTAFMINSFIYKAKIKAIELKFLNGKKKNISLSDFVKKLYRIDDKRFDELCDSIRTELIDDVQSADFLLKHTDMSYNVIKRIISDMIYTSDNNLKATKKPTGEPPEVISEFYQGIIYRLSEQDKKYHLIGSESFSQRFETNPVVKLFVRKIEDNGKEKYLFSNMISNKWIKLEFETENHTDDESVEVADKTLIHICADITVYNKEESKKEVNTETQNKDIIVYDESQETPPPETGTEQN